MSLMFHNFSSSRRVRGCIRMFRKFVKANPQIHCSFWCVLWCKHHYYCAIAFSKQTNTTYSDLLLSELWGYRKRVRRQRERKRERVNIYYWLYFHRGIHLLQLQRDTVQIKSDSFLECFYSLYTFSQQRFPSHWFKPENSS